jgi:hypothetical protein
MKSPGSSDSSSRKNVCPAETGLASVPLVQDHRLLGAAVHGVHELGPRHAVVVLRAHLREDLSMDVTFASRPGLRKVTVGGWSARTSIV